MKRFKNYLLAAFGFACVGAIGMVSAPGTVQAIVASLVNVVNMPLAPSAASDVVTIWCIPHLTPPTSVCSLNGLLASDVYVQNPDASISGPYADGPPIPAGKVLIITSISVQGCTLSSFSGGNVQISFGGPNVTMAGANFISPSGSNCFRQSFTFPTGIVVRKPLISQFFGWATSADNVEGSLNGFYAPDN